jgi:L,D-peptidoglycan transpeptidase YkuD (ErfK/YbiS/YcfS/YnhG family)
LKKLLFSIAILFSSLLVVGQNADSLYVVNYIISHISANKEFGKVKQLVVAYQNPNLNPLQMVAGLVKKGGKWKVAIAPVRASIGRNGLAKFYKEKLEGDGQTPTGLYDLGQLYTYEAIVNTSIPFQQVDSLDKWIDDSSSNDYNKYVRGETLAKSFEHLKLNSIDYKYCMVIEYNTHPVVKGKGSAIFFHLADEKYTPTAGCVAIAENDMLQFLRWFKPNKKKAIWITGMLEVLE